MALFKSYSFDTFLARIVVMQVWDCSLEKSPVSMENNASVLHTQRESAIRRLRYPNGRDVAR
jgi:hypothetical protein